MKTNSNFKAVFLPLFLFFFTLASCSGGGTPSSSVVSSSTTSTTSTTSTVTSESSSKTTSTTSPTSSSKTTSSSETSSSSSTTSSKEQVTVKINDFTNVIEKNKSIDVTAKVTGSSKVVSWTVDDDSIVTIDQTGHVTAIKEGTTNIIASVDEANDSKSITVIDGFIKFDKTSLDLLVGNSETITATTYDKGVSLIWESNNPSVASVSNGVVSALSAGSALISATYNSHYAYCSITVTENKSISFDINSATIQIGETVTITATKHGITSDLSWTSNASSIASVNNGVVTGVSEGDATISASAEGESASANIKVITAFISLDKTNISKVVEEDELLTATTYDPSATVSWNSSNTSVATVNNGLVHASGVGSATITATTGKYQATCTVTVSSQPEVNINEHSVTLVVGQKMPLKASATGGSDIVWTNTESSVCSVSNGLIEAKAVGTSVVTASTNEVGVKADTCNVKVINPTTITTLDSRALVNGTVIDHTTIQGNITNFAPVAQSTLEQSDRDILASSGRFSSYIEGTEITSTAKYLSVFTMFNGVFSTASYSGATLHVEFDVYFKGVSTSSTVYVLPLNSSLAQQGEPLVTTTVSASGVYHFDFHKTIDSLDNTYTFGLYIPFNCSVGIGDIYVKGAALNSNAPSAANFRNTFDVNFVNFGCYTNNGNDNLLDLSYFDYPTRKLLEDTKVFKTKGLVITSQPGAESHVFSTTAATNAPYFNNTNLIPGETLRLDIYFYIPTLTNFYLIGVGDGITNLTLGQVKADMTFENGSYTEGSVTTLGEHVYRLTISTIIQDNFNNGINIYSPDSTLQFLIGRMSVCMSDTTLSDEGLKKDNVYQQYWNHDGVIYNEPVLFYEHSDSSIYSQLMFNPTKILSVTTYDMQTSIDPTYFNVDASKKITTTYPGYKYLTQANVNCSEVPSDLGTIDTSKVASGKILFTESPELYSYCYLVTYQTSEKMSYQPVKQGDTLSISTLLANKKAINLVVYGDSIAAGCHSSANLGIYPNHPIWGQAFANEIERNYGVAVNYTNSAVGGMISTWGKDNIYVDACSKSPDIAVIGFGMNDASTNLTREEYKANTQAMIEALKAANPDVTIILIATMVANPLSAQANGQEQYLQDLIDLQNAYPNVGLCNMTNLSSEIFAAKDPLELLANNVNHPNDFIVRQYVSLLMNCLDK